MNKVYRNGISFIIVILCGIFLGNSGVTGSDVSTSCRLFADYPFFKKIPGLILPSEGKFGFLVITRKPGEKLWLRNEPNGETIATVTFLESEGPRKKIQINAQKGVIILHQRELERFSEEKLNQFIELKQDAENQANGLVLTISSHQGVVLISSDTQGITLVAYIRLSFNKGKRIVVIAPNSIHIDRDEKGSQPINETLAEILKEELGAQ